MTSVCQVTGAILELEVVPGIPVTLNADVTTVVQFPLNATEELASARYDFK